MMGRNVYLSDEDQQRIYNLAGDWMMRLDDDVNEMQYGPKSEEELEKSHQDRRAAERIMNKMVRRRSR